MKDLRTSFISSMTAIHVKKKKYSPAYTEKDYDGLYVVELLDEEMCITKDREKALKWYNAMVEMIIESYEVNGEYDGDTKSIQEEYLTTNLFIKK